MTQAGGAGNATPSQEEYYRATLGPNNTEYYLARFRRFDAAGKAGASWHWPAFFITFYWLLYRKMWLPAFIYFIAPYVAMAVLGIVTVMAGDNGAMVVIAGYLLLFIALWVGVPMYSNALYYNHCRKRIAETRAESQDVQRVLGTLSGRGGTSWVPVIILGVFLFIAVIGILAAIAIPQYQQYRTKAQLAGAYTYGRQAADSVAKYYHRHQSVPATLDEAGFNMALPVGISSISVDEQSGVVTITLANGPVANQSLLMVPELDEQGRISWSCGSDEIKEQLLPTQCR